MPDGALTCGFLPVYPYYMAEKWIELTVTSDCLEAEMIKDLLESGGIEVNIRSCKVSPYPVNIGKMGEIKVFVREQDRESAEIMMKDIQTGQAEQDPDQER